MVSNQKSPSLLLLLRPHRNLGYLLVPFLGYYNKYEHEALIESPITRGDLPDVDLSVEEREIVEIAENYSESELLKRFVKRKKGGELSEPGFFGNTNREKYEHVIRPFIDARLNEVYEKALAINIPVFYKEATDAAKTLKQEIQLSEDNIRAKFFFLRHQDGIAYQLELYDHQQVLDLKNGDVQVVSHHPLILLKDDRLMCISELHAKNLTPFLNKDKVLIPKKFEENYLKSFIRKTIRDFDVRLEGIVLNEIKDNVPKCVLEFTTDFSGFPVLQLKFYYDTMQVSVNDKVRPLVSLQHYEKEGEVVFRKVLRNTGKEREALRELKQSGLKSQRESFFSIAEHPEATEKFFVEWINKNVNHLKEKGFEIKQLSNRREYYIGTVDLNTSVKQDKNDWFDLYMEIQLEGFSFPFVDLVDNLKKGEREFFLEDGRVFIIPEAWFADYIDLLRYSRITPHGLSVSKHHFGLLPENKVQEEYDERLPGELQDLFLRRFDEPAKDPETLTGSLRDYQRFGLSWLLQLNKLELGGCLADDMGLGKTIQTIALLLATQNKNTENSNEIAQSQLALFDDETPVGFPSLLVMPTSLLYNWKNEFASFAPSLKVLVYSGKREGLTAQFSEYDVIITSYGIMRIDVDIL
ncbi:MAG TPA: SNF2-related protein, partial [Bacteroidales bacterium]|nr:SNF2-related protein [Bacteroidales bacterium]